jgi:N-acetylglucosamine-6-phosphate deacetylase
MLGSLKVRLDETGRVAVPGQPNLAGSALSLDRAIGNTVKFTGLPLAEVLAMASMTPATYLGITTSGTIHARWDATTFSFSVNRIA